MIKHTPAIALLMFASTAAAGPPPPATALEPAPVSAYGKLDAMEDVQISQDGRRIAYIAANGDDRMFVIQQVGGPILQTVSANHRKVMYIAFADSDHVLLSIRGTERFGGDEGLAELSAVLLFNLKTGKGQQVYPNGDVVANGPPVAVVHKNDHVYGYFLGEAQPGGTGTHISSGEPGQTSLYRTDLDSLVSTLEVRGTSQTSDFAVGPDGQVVAQVEEYDHGQGWRVLSADGGRVFATGATVWGQPEVYAYGRTPSTIIIKQPGDGDFEPPREIDLATGKIGDPLVDGAEATPLRDRATRMTVGFLVGGYANDAAFLDPAVDAKWQGVRAAFKDDVVSLVSYDQGFNHWVVKTEGSHNSGRYYLVDLAASKATMLGAIRPQIKPDQVGAFSWFDYSARDGTKLKGVLTLPPGRDPKNLALVMMPHGGPGNGSYDKPDFDWWAQAIASRGYAVFQPDFRGSGGLGHGFETSGWGQWGRLMQSDVSDAIPALAAKGIIDPSRACIVGWSYGGYATLAGVTLQNGLYRCAAAGGAVSDLNDMMAWVQARSESKLDPGVRYWSKAIGLKGVGDSSGAAYSPAKQAARADAPILLIHGKDDSVVPFRQAEEMARALRGAGKTVDMVVLPTSDHWIGNGTEANRNAMLTAMIGWLEKYNPPN